LALLPSFKSQFTFIMSRLNAVSKAIATRDLTELVEKFKTLKRTGDIRAGTNYILIGS
jgi:ATP-dependent DNA helicase RecG